MTRLILYLTYENRPGSDFPASFGRSCNVLPIGTCNNGACVRAPEDSSVTVGRAFDF